MEIYEVPCYLLPFLVTLSLFSFSTLFCMIPCLSSPFILIYQVLYLCNTEGKMIFVSNSVLICTAWHIHRLWRAETTSMNGNASANMLFAVSCPWNKSRNALCSFQLYTWQVAVPVPVPCHTGYKTALLLHFGFSGCRQNFAFETIVGNLMAFP